MKRIKFGLAALAAAGLVACGGGGGGGGGSPNNPVPPTLTLSGAAAKGILINANVSVYMVVDGEKQIDPLTSAVTKEDGSYLLRFASTANPLVIQVTTGQDTLMLDETGALVDGEFPSVPAPEGLVLRSIALPNATSTSLSVSVTPFTEAAVAAAEAGSFSNEAIREGMNLARGLTTVDPFITRPTSIKTAKEQAEVELLIALTGFAQNASTLASSAKGGCLPSEADLVCSVRALQEQMVSAFDSDPILRDAARANIERFRADYLDIQQINLPPQFDNAKITLAGKLQSLPALDQVGNTDEEAAIETRSNETLEGFVVAMRDGFRAAEQALRDTEENVLKRYENVVFEGVNEALNLITKATVNCDYDFESSPHVLVCDTLNGFTLTSPGKYSFSNTFMEGSHTGTVEGAYSIDDGFTFEVNADSIGVNNQKLSNASLIIALAGFDKNGDPKGDNFDVSLNVSGTYTAYSSDAKSNVKLTFKDIEVTVKETPKTGFIQSDIELNGEIEISSSLGEKFDGYIEVLAEEKQLENSDDRPLKLSKFNFGLKASSSATASNGYMALDFIGSRTPMEFGPLNYETFSINLKLDLNDEIVVVIDQTKTSKDFISTTASISSGSSVAKLSVDSDTFFSFNDRPKNQYCFYADRGYFCGDTIKISTAAGSYTAFLKYGDDSADVKDSAGKIVGKITRKGIQVDGREISFY